VEAEQQWGWFNGEPERSIGVQQTLVDTRSIKESTSDLQTARGQNGPRRDCRAIPDTFDLREA
jgi:hypothetical protein